MKRYRATILIILIFIIDCVTSNLPDIIGYNVDTSRDWWYTFVVPYMAGISLFHAMPYFLLLLIAINSSLKKPITFEWEFPDALLLCVVICTNFKTAWDWEHNANEMKEGNDWIAFLTVIISLIVLKICWTKLQKIISKIRAL